MRVQLTTFSLSLLVSYRPLAEPFHYAWMLRPPPLNASRSIQRITSVSVDHYEFTKKFYNARGRGDR